MTPEIEILDRVRSILAGAGVSRTRNCSCAHCREVQARRLDCPTCGFRGVPLTMPCNCARNAEQHIEFAEATLAAYTGGAWPADWKSRRSDLARVILELRRLGPIGVCAGNGKGMPEVEAVLFGFEGNCAHGAPYCPICGDTGDGEIGDTAAILAVLRDVNTAIRSLSH